MRKRIWQTGVAFVFACLMLFGTLTPVSDTVVTPVLAVTQADIDEAQKRADELSAKQAELKKELSAVSTQKSDAMKKKNIIDQQVATTNAEINQLQKQIDQYNALIAQTQEELTQAEEEEARQTEIFHQRVRAMEERGSVSYWSVLFHSVSFSDLLSSLNFINEIAESDQAVITRLLALQEDIKAKKATLEDSRDQVKTQKTRLEEKKAELSKRQSEAEAVVKEIKSNEAYYQKLLKQAQADQEAEQRKIVQMSRELAAKNGTATTLGGYIWPTSSHYITSPFGGRNTGIQGASTNHKGIDIGRVYYSSQVVAVKAGTVIISTYNSARGNYVVISHGSGNTSLYQHLSSRAVSVGDVVKQGQAIGVTGASGISSGPHLHFELTENGVQIDPLRYLTGYIQGW